ncbi:MAG: DUF389 domain-containing protein [Acidimicrobiia bacterium]
MSSLLHVRAVVPERLHRALLDDLREHVAVCNIVVVAGVADEPEGHLVLFDVVREAADEIVALLQAHDVHREGAFSLEHTEFSMGAGSDRAARLAPGDAEGAVIWSEVKETVAADSGLSIQFLAFFLVGSLIAAVGVLTDSPILIVGAMVVGPEYGSLAAMAFGLHARDWPLLKRGAVTFTVGTIAAIAIACLLGVALRAIDRIPPTYIPGRPLTGFIAQPDFFAPIVAAAAAVAGVLSLTLTRTGTLVGVLISVTTIPAIADIGLGIATTNADEALGSLRQLTINVVCLVVVGAITLSMQRSLRGRYQQAPHHRR